MNSSPEMLRKFIFHQFLKLESVYIYDLFIYLGERERRRESEGRG